MNMSRRIRRVIAVGIVTLLAALFLKVVISSQVEIHVIVLESMEIHISIER